jgi:hypothetical protein
LLFSSIVLGTHSIPGEFIATKSQNQVIEADIKLEKEEHFKFHREVEEMQVCSSCVRHVRFVPFAAHSRSGARVVHQVWSGGRAAGQSCQEYQQQRRHVTEVHAQGSLLLLLDRICWLQS